jgi:hypothetical protein
LHLPDFFSAASRYNLLISLSVVQEFSSYSAYRQHVESVCEARVRACHICGKTFISVARLNTHVQARAHKKSFLLSFEILKGLGYEIFYLRFVS